MTYTRIYDPTPDMREFAIWLEKQTYQLLNDTSEWEILRIHTIDQEGYPEIWSAYRNRKGRESWHPDLRSLYHTFKGATR